MGLATQTIIKKAFNPFKVAAGFIYRSMCFIKQFFVDTRSLVHFTGKTRRFLLVHFRKSYVRQQLQLRQGQCKQCGACCNLLFICPALTKEGRCLVYGAFRPLACKVFPIDQRDIDEVALCGFQCGYSFPQTNSEIAPSKSS